MNVDPQLDYFIDTNILVFAYDRSAGEKHKIAAQLLESCWENENGCLSPQVLQEFYITVTQKIAIPLDFQSSQQIVSDLTHWRLHSPDAGDLLQAIDLQHQHQLPFWDALIVHSATCLGCRQLLSEDLSHGQVFGKLQVVNPFKDLV
jgi:predicted nucleic acid-binding protein